METNRTPRQPEAPARPPWLDVPAGPPTSGGGGWDAATSPAPPPQRTTANGGRRSWAAPLAGGLAGAVVALVVLAGAVATGVVATGERQGALVDRPAFRLTGEPLDIQGVIEAVRPGVVSIMVQGVNATPIGNQLVSGAGSGMVIQPDGLVLTNAHVVEGATAISVMLADGREVPADLVGSMPSSDVALVQARGVRGLDVVQLGESSAMQVGDDVVAVGNALNLGATPTVTTGIVSALNRSITEPGGANLESLIQTDAAINRGNSGGPLVNAAGQVIGVNTAIAGGAENIGFALSIDSVKPLIEELRSGGGEVRGVAYLGVLSADIENVTPEALSRLGIDQATGAFVAEVQPRTAAAEAGLQPGDVIVSIDGEDVENAADVSAAIARSEPGQVIEIGYVRRGEVRTTTATLGARELGER
ncbi:MAG: trypsin-like peptidase domain-containing protein [Actinobacteria bacterium]|nr:trypsin-like peptidase domain-containing protein [Actinomycetota bacterium]